MTLRLELVVDEAVGINPAELLLDDLVRGPAIHAFGSHASLRGGLGPGSLGATCCRGVATSHQFLPEAHLPILLRRRAAAAAGGGGAIAQFAR